MSKVAGRLKQMRKAVAKVDHGNKMKTNIRSCMAVAGPPLGPMLGQYGVNIAAFCKDFNERTKHMKEGIPLPCRLTVNPDRSYKLIIHHPPATYFLKQAAGIEIGSMVGGNEIAGKVTLKHIYEIAKIKSEDPPLQLASLEDICNMMVGVARSCGIEVVRDLDPVEYQEFLKERKTIVAEQKRELQEAKEAKMLRTV